jgi:hypothetical protein
MGHPVDIPNFRDSDTKALFFSASEEFAAKEDKNEVSENDDEDFGSCQILRPDQVMNVLKSVMPKETVTVGFTGTIFNKTEKASSHKPRILL